MIAVIASEAKQSSRAPAGALRNASLFARFARDWIASSP
jgi:hypothetical protein